MRPGAAALLFVLGLAEGACRDGRARRFRSEIEAGQALSTTHGCGTCHGLTGRGDGPLAKTLTPPPPGLPRRRRVRERRRPAVRGGHHRHRPDPRRRADAVVASICPAASVISWPASSFPSVSQSLEPMPRPNSRSHTPSPLLAALTLVASTGIGAQAPLTVTGAWVREPVPGQPTAAAYALVENRGFSDVQIVAAAADIAGTAEIHEMVRSGDMMKMAPLKSVTVPEQREGGAQARRTPRDAVRAEEAREGRRHRDADVHDQQRRNRVQAAAPVRKAQMP